eukprot:146759-Rhodomonas_salina.4
MTVVTAEAQDQVERRLFLDVVVSQRPPVLKLLARKDQALLVWRDAFLVLDLLFHRRDRVCAAHVARHCFARQRLDEHLHASASSCPLFARHGILDRLCEHRRVALGSAWDLTQHRHLVRDQLKLDIRPVLIRWIVHITKQLQRALIVELHAHHLIVVLASQRHVTILLGHLQPRAAALRPRIFSSDVDFGAAAHGLRGLALAEALRERFRELLLQVRPALLDSFGSGNNDVLFLHRRDESDM